MSFDELDKQIMRITQAGLPLSAQPYHQIAAQLHLSPDCVMSRINAMKASGVIRRIAAVPNHYRLGYRFNGMTVWNIDDAAIEVCGERVGALPFVSHCYHRPRHLPDWPYNLFAMIHGRTQDEIDVKMTQLTDLLSEFCAGHDVLYSTRILKKTGFRSRIVDNNP